MLNKKYLMRQGESEVKAIPSLLQGKAWDHFVAIPCCGEDELLPHTIESLENTKKIGSTLVFLLINEGPSTSIEYKESNRRTLKYLEQKFPGSILQTEPKTSIHYGNSIDIIWMEKIDENQFPKKKGVGLARKICSDLGLALYQEGHLKRPWIHNTDGDAKVPMDYFSQLEGASSQHSAVLYKYRHTPSGKDHLENHWSAAILYESWLRYYVLGLRYAGSPYAFPTIGSTITINAISYSQVQGFPRREAGEDFYLLNKLFKVGGIHVPGGEPIVLQDRVSSRVPFGTGQGTQKIENTLDEGDEYQVYHPQCFELLKLYLESVSESILKGKSWQAPKELQHNSILKEVSDTAKGIEDSISRSRSKEKALEQFHHWFDAFKTLKFIHACRDHLCGSLTVPEALLQAGFIDIDKSCSDWESLEQLRVLEEAMCLQ